MEKSIQMLGHALRSPGICLTLEFSQLNINLPKDLSGFRSFAN